MEGGKGVSASSYDNDEKFEWKKFDQYSFAVIHSASVDEKRKRNAKKRQGYVVSYDIDWIAESEPYQIEYIISDNDGHSGKVSIERLYEAMLELDDNLKEVLLLKFWYKTSKITNFNHQDYMEIARCSSLRRLSDDEIRAVAERNLEIYDKL